ncbi:MAG TPA: response regulator [Candidatus Angelobacter sp.]|nr:response regulator [Candidatus Angelobacter sp.]
MAAAVPTIYFIDDSATMREVIKIAFRRENMDVLASHDAVAALAEIEQKRPDVVITDVIMPEKDGYEVCQFIKNHPELAKTPVILMSGVVNRAVAERAFSVKADELLRKPFQPQDLIARVRSLLQGSAASAAAPAAASSAAAALSAIFSPAIPPVSVVPAAPAAIAAVGNSKPVVPAAPAASAASAPWASSRHDLITDSAEVFAQTAPPKPAIPASSISPGRDLGLVNHSGQIFAPAAASPSPAPMRTAGASPVANSGNGGSATNGNSVTKLKVEVLRLEGLIKKLHAELEAEREYSRSLEAHIKTLREID